MAHYRKAASRLGKDLHAVVRDTEALLAATGDFAEDSVKDLRTRAQKSLKMLRTGMADLPDDALEYLQDASETAEAAIRRQPLPALGLAIGVGFILGLLAIARR